jgi:hypothetical protein
VTWMDVTMQNCFLEIMDKVIWRMDCTLFEWMMAGSHVGLTPGAGKEPLYC